MLAAIRARVISLRDAPLDPSCTGEVLCPNASEEALCRAGTDRREMVVGNFHNCFGSDWFPFASTIGAPAAGPPGALPVNPGGFLSASNFLVNARRSEALKADVNPT